MTTKHCNGCKETKDEESFRMYYTEMADGTIRGYRYSQCIACRQKSARRAYAIRVGKELPDEPMEITLEPYHPHLYPMDQALRHLGVFT